MSDLPDSIPAMARCAGLSGYGDPRGPRCCPVCDEAIVAAGLRDGMTVSFHHHLRNGDAVLNAVMAEIAALGLCDIHVAASSVFPVHGPLAGSYAQRCGGRADHVLPDRWGGGCGGGRGAGTACRSADPWRTGAGHRVGPDADRRGLCRGAGGGRVWQYQRDTGAFCLRGAGLSTRRCAACATGRGGDGSSLAGSAAAGSRSVAGTSIGWSRLDSIGDAARIVSGTTQVTTEARGAGDRPAGGAGHRGVGAVG